MIIQALNRESFKRYGDVVDASTHGEIANQGTARRLNFLTQLVNNRSSSIDGISQSLCDPPAKLNVCIFRSQPAELPFHIKLLERHQYSSQMFIPMTDKEASYLVVVCVNDPKTNKPDFSTLACFRGTSKQGFNYKANIWHHPMIALQSQIDFVCFVFERRESQSSSDEDTEEVFFPKTPIIAQMPKL